MRIKTPGRKLEWAVMILCGRAKYNRALTFGQIRTFSPRRVHHSLVCATCFVIFHGLRQTKQGWPIVGSTNPV